MIISPRRTPSVKLESQFRQIIGENMFIVGAPDEAVVLFSVRVYGVDHSHLCERATVSAQVGRLAFLYPTSILQVRVRKCCLVNKHHSFLGF